jgi:hypothetical protein
MRIMLQYAYNNGLLLESCEEVAHAKNTGIPHGRNDDILLHFQNQPIT